jgi:NTE family protein
MPKQRFFHSLLPLIFCCLTAAGQTTAPGKLPKVGLVLSGGGARASSDIGVLKVLEQERIPIDCIAATSFGALVGGLYSLGYSASEIESILTSQDWNSIFNDTPQSPLARLLERKNDRYQGQLTFKGWNPELPTGLWEGQRLSEVLDGLTTDRLLKSRYDFDKLPIPFRAVATNLIDGKPYVFREGSMTEALRASMAVPLLFTPVEKDGMLLADGGLSANLPTEVARSMGADIIIAVDATTPLLDKDKIRNFVNVIDQSISLQMERNVEESRKHATIVLQPALDKYSNSNYDRIPEIVKLGENAARGRIPELKALVAGIPFHRLHPAEAVANPVIESISFKGLKKVGQSQLESKIHLCPGEAADPARIASDVNRLFGTGLFDSVTYTLEYVGADHCRLIFTLKESATNAIGASLRYDASYDFVALAEFTAHQLFNSPTTLTISSQFGGLEDYFASLHAVPGHAQFLFVEPRVEFRRLDRLDIRDQAQIDTFNDRRETGQLLFGGSVFRQLEISGGYRAENVRISGGSQPRKAVGSTLLSGFTLKLRRDSLDSSEFPRRGMILRAQLDKRMEALGSDLEYSKFQVDYQQSYSATANSTLQFNASLGYSRGPVPFYDLFFVGGYSFSELASRQFLGLDRDEIAANQIAVFGASYRWQAFSRPLSFLKRGFLTGAYNGVFSSARQSSPFDFEFLNGVGLGFGLDTIIGPFRAMGGWGESGRFHFYVTVGPTF